MNIEVSCILFLLDVYYFCFEASIFDCILLPALIGPHESKSGWHLYLPKRYQNTSLRAFSEYFRKTMTTSQ